ncbi:MAG: hypothetical protein AAFR56_10345 [Chloroflexota bacterium]
MTAMNKESFSALFARIRDLFRYPTPYEGEHIHDPMFLHLTGAVPAVATPQKMRGFNRRYVLWYGGICTILISLIVSVPSTPLTIADLPAVLVLPTALLFVGGFLFDVYAATESVNGFYAFRRSATFAYMRVIPLAPIRLAHAQYRLLLLRTWQGLWILLITRWVVVIGWGVWMMSSLIRSSATTGYVLSEVFYLLPVYVALGYVFIREPYWRWRIMVAIGMQQAVRYSSQPAAVFWSVAVVGGFWVMRFFVGISTGIFFLALGIFSVGSIGVILRELMRANGLYTAVAVSNFLLIVFFLATFAWAYRLLLLDGTDPYEIGVTEKLHVKLKSLLDRED